MSVSLVHNPSHTLAHFPLSTEIRYLQPNCERAICSDMTNLAKMIVAYQGKYDVPAKAASTLTRIKQGKMPDADGFAKIILWMTE
jgi:hypothetical protein